MPVRFLIADDMPAQQKLLANVVLFLGGESRFASNGTEALRLAQEESFDIILLDLSMPELGGVAAANDLIEGWAALSFRPRIVAVTGEKDEGSRALCRAVGMDGFIGKPFTMTALRKALKHLLTRGHCWTESAARRILNVSALDSDIARHLSTLDQEVLEARTALEELAKHLETLSPEQRAAHADTALRFAKRQGLVQLAPLMESILAIKDPFEATPFLAALADQRAEFEHAVTAIRAWRHHAPRPLRLSA